MSLLIVIVNYRTAGLTLDCLRSLRGEVASMPGARVVVVDNASGDGSAETLAAAIAEQGWEDWASVLPLETNGGFAAGNNAAIGPALQAIKPPSYVLLLNPDTVVRPGALSSLVQFLEARPEVGIVGSRLEDPDGRPQCSAFRFPSILGELEGGLRLGLATRLLARWRIAPSVPADACPTDWVSGACLLARREVFKTVGLLDNGYFLYFEEVDFCKRAERAGWSCWYVPEARVVHLEGQTPGVRGQSDREARRPAYWFHSRRRYFRTHLGPVRARLANLAWALGFATFRVRQVLQRKSDTDPPRLLRDFLRHNFLSVSGGRA
ncbi:glycosyltransferase family 2 protein [soil metagenome]